MKRLILATTLFGALMASGPVRAGDPGQPPLGGAGGAFAVPTPAVGAMAEGSGGEIVTDFASVRTAARATPEIDFSYFLTDNIALDLFAAVTRHVPSIGDMSVGHADVGRIWVLPPTLTVQYHFAPRERLSPYVGAGVNASFLYGTSPSGPTTNHLTLNSTFGPALQAGLDYRLSGHWSANLDVKQIFFDAADGVEVVGGRSQTTVNPLIVGLGFGYRF
jgi:outer membrane protein